ncbi:MAG: DNA-binding protein [Chloroflexi bacterium CG07_land_8_20_14_0_80_51_10]|nr:MAG: DNA-binding protein [Chloroflexi bacterium CG07_land_8_20_14_0_80_51_10]
METDHLLSTDDVGTILKISKITVQRWCHEGKIPAAKIGKAYRIKKTDLDRWYEDKLLENTVFQ